MLKFFSSRSGRFAMSRGVVVLAGLWGGVLGGGVLGGVGCQATGPGGESVSGESAVSSPARAVPYLVGPEALAGWLDVTEERQTTHPSATRPTRPTASTSRTSQISPRVTSGTLVVHVGHGRRGYERAHVPGAVYLDFDEIYVNRELAMEMPDPAVIARLVRRLGIDSAERVVLVGDASGVFPARFFVTLAHFGFGDRVTMLDGHMKGWQERGLPTASAASELTAAEALRPPEPSAHSGNDTKPVIRPGVLVSRGEVEAALIDARTPPVPGAAAGVVPGSELQPPATSPRTVVLDVRPHAQFTGDKRGPGVEVNGRIQGAVNSPWMTWFTGHSPPWLRAEDELRDLLGEAGITPGTRVVIYDTSGIHGSMAWVVLRHLGYEASLYDGGFEQWSQDW